ncbi:YdcF family protein [Photobacterium leiognathi subsp. mandapamensis]|uniref:YdcF family protein n=1 Tax=Photobacterium leiognathi TaxID=553611 RepID=UPI003AF3A7EF
MPKRIYDLAKRIWDYHQLNHTMVKSDCIFVLGSNDDRVAERAVELYKQGLAPYIVFSGGVGELTEGLYSTSEAEHFAKIAMDMGVPQQDILIEPESTNTGENVVFTRRLLEQEGLHPSSFILVQKPFMERRALATFEQQWPNMPAIVTSPQLSFDDYANDVISFGDLINVMAGDLQRIRFYPELGFSTKQPIPEDVWDAFECLVNHGFDQHLSIQLSEQVS